MNNNINTRKKNNILQDTNTYRNMIGLPSLKFIWCKICRQVNQHFWWNCNRVLCSICNGNHFTKQCQLLKTCQYCGSSEHLSQLCDDDKGLMLKSMKHRTCTICKKKGHIAKECNTANFGQTIWKRRHRYRPKRRRRRRKK